MAHNHTHPAPVLVLQLNYSIDLQAIYLPQSTWVDNMVDKTDASYLYQKRGVYYFSKQVPCDVKQHYSRNRIVICLRTKSLSKAMRSCKSILQRLEDYWMSFPRCASGQHSVSCLKPSCQTRAYGQSCSEIYCV